MGSRMRRILNILGLMVVIYLLLLALSTPTKQSKDQEKVTPVVSTNSYQQAQVSLVAYTEDQPEKKLSPQKRKGAFISVSADYRRYLGFSGYVHLMKANGARFFLFDAIRHELIAEVDPLVGTFSPPDQKKLARLSPRAREIHKEIAVNKIIRSAEERYGNRKYKILLLLSQKLDDQIQDSIRRALQRQGVDSDLVTQVNGVYHQNALKIYSINHIKKGELPVEINIHF